MNNATAKDYVYQILSQMGRRRIMLLLVLLSSLMLLCLYFAVKISSDLLLQQSTIETFTVVSGFPLKNLYLRGNLSVPSTEQYGRQLPIPQILSGKAPFTGDNWKESNIRQMQDEMAMKQLNSILPNSSSPDWVLVRKRAKNPKETDLRNATQLTSSQQLWKYIPAMRLVHFDLKGAPPLVSYYKEIFPVLKKAGANGILMEYEDVFPYWGPLASTAAHNAYSKRDVQDIIETATTNGLEVIPLVQTFGHLEYILKLEQFKHIREVEHFPQALCPKNNDSLVLVRNIIDQVLSLHPKSKWLHIGSDEVYHLGLCQKCELFQHSDLFLSHVSSVARYVKETHKVKPIMWDDMLRHITVEKLIEYQMGSLVEPMVWAYVKDVYLFAPETLWEKYRQVFPVLWTASAFKGAFGETLTVPNVKLHLENNRAWLQVMGEQSSKHQLFRGIALTGWQRYDHMATLCELFPSGLPSLILNLLTANQGYFTEDLYPTFQDLMSCYSKAFHHLDLVSDPNMWDAAGVCFFPGSPVFRLTQHHDYIIKNVAAYIHDVTVHKGWLTSYNVRHNFTSPMRVDELMKDFGMHNSSLSSLATAARDALHAVFDDYTVLEWMEQNIYPYITKMKNIWEDALSMRKIKVWPRRPLPLLEDVMKVINDTKY